MNLTEAYKLVYQDIKDNGPKMFQGHYDARIGYENGTLSAELIKTRKESFMYGISTVMEYLANYAEDEDFNNNFIQNMMKCEEIAEKE